MTHHGDLDTYARITLVRIQRGIERRGGIATRVQMERMREAYAQLHRDTERVCAARRREI